MTKIFKISTLLILGIFILQNCKHEIPNKNGFPGDPTPVTLADTCSLDTVYFVNDILPILLSNCAQSDCHDAIAQEDGVILTDYDNIIETGKVDPGRPDNSDLYEVLLETDPEKIMPPPPASLTPEQKNAIRIWISQGAKNNKCENKCDTSAVSFGKNIWPIVESTCKGCHTYPNGNGGVFMSGYGDIKDLVDDKRLDGVINHRAGFKPMPPPPGQLEQCAKDQIRVWINSGAPNN